MAIIDDEMKQDIDYLSLLDSLNANATEDSVSLKDVNWADSCINKDMDSSQDDWSSVKDALLEIISSQQGPSTSSVAESSGRSVDNEILHYRENVSALKFGNASDLADYFMYDDAGEVKSTDLSEDEEEEDVILGNNGIAKTRSRNVFRPNYTEDMVGEQKLDSDMDSGLTTYDVENSSADIFKVWDLGVSEEVDDLTKQLNKALAEIPTSHSQSVDDSTLLEHNMNASVDDLIAGVGGLSLTHRP